MELRGAGTDSRDSPFQKFDAQILPPLVRPKRQSTQILEFVYVPPSLPPGRSGVGIRTNQPCFSLPDSRARAAFGEIGLPPECFVTEHRLDLGFLRGETEPKRIAGGWNLTE
jgi:hypothetical protein